MVKRNIAWLQNQMLKAILVHGCKCWRVINNILYNNIGDRRIVNHTGLWKYDGQKVVKSKSVDNVKQTFQLDNNESRQMKCMWHVHRKRCKEQQYDRKLKIINIRLAPIPLHNANPQPFTVLYWPSNSHLRGEWVGGDALLMFIITRWFCETVSITFSRKRDY